MYLPTKTLKDYQHNWLTWYSGDKIRLVNLYHREYCNYWSNIDKEEYRNATHVPLAQDISALSANLLFGKTPRLKCENETFIDYYEDIGATLVEAAEMCSAAGGIFLKMDIDETLSNRAIITTRSPLETNAIFSSGYLQNVTFKRKLEEDIYLLEMREVIDGGLAIVYEIVDDKYNEIETDEYDYENEFIPGFDSLGVAYIPNMLPNRLFLDSSEGVSDYQGVTDLLASLDETYSSLMRDIMLGMSRLLVDQDMLKTDWFGSDINSQSFDIHQRTFIKLAMDEWRIEGATKPITQVQFNIRYKEHIETIKTLIKQIVSSAGYSPASFGFEESSGAESGKAVKLRQRKSMITTHTKQRYWQNALETFFFDLQTLENITGLVSQTPAEVQLDFRDNIGDSMVDISEIVRNLAQADAASLESMVKMINPDWTEEQIEEEIQRIRTNAVPTEMLGG